MFYPFYKMIKCNVTQRSKVNYSRWPIPDNFRNLVQSRLQSGCCSFQWSQDKDLRGTCTEEMGASEMDQNSELIQLPQDFLQTSQLSRLCLNDSLCYSEGLCMDWSPSPLYHSSKGALLSLFCLFTPTPSLRPQLRSPIPLSNSQLVEIIGLTGDDW